jgi:2,4-dienoyl-CoA reductase (NADPH2)
MANAYPHLLAPGRIGSLSLRNRIFLTAMGVNLGDTQGNITPRIREFCAEVAKGGAAMVNIGVVGVDWPVGGNQPYQIAISDDRYIPGFQSVADAVHAHGAKLAVQLHFGGLVGMEDALAGRPTWTPSIPPAKDSHLLDGFLEEELAEAPFGRVTGFDYKVMTRQDIDHLVQRFAAGAERAKRAGVDGVEIHGGHGYIISSFLSPYTNQRTDEYGGSIENRSRFLVEILQAIRAAVGPDYPMWCKIDSQEFGLEGITLQDATTTARLAQQAGADAITVTSYQDSTIGVLHSGSHTPDVPGWTLHNAAAIKAAVDIPVIASGRVEVAVGEKHIADGRFDFLAMGRKLLADPYLPKKLAENRAEHVRPCIYCYTCISEIYYGRSTKCAVNPEMSFERELAVVPAAQKKRVVVVGGGPAGMESARRLALKGHKVTLLEQTDRLGGTLQFASIAYEPNEGILDWLKQEVAESTVDVRLNTVAGAEVLKALEADEVVVATGAVRKMPPIPGADRANVFSGDDMRKLVLGEDLDQLKVKTGWTTRLAAKAASLTGATKSPEFIRQATRTWMPLGERIVIIGGELVGLELAEFLAHRGRKVAVVDDAARLGAGLTIVRRWRVFDELEKLDVPLYKQATDIAIGDNEVSYRNSHGQIRRLAADHVIVAKGATGDLTLANELRAAGFKVHSVGDCNGIGYISGAMRAAAEVAVKI